MHGKASATVATATALAPAAPTARDPAYGHSSNKRVHSIASSCRSSKQQQPQQASTQKYHYELPQNENTTQKKRKEKKEATNCYVPLPRSHSKNEARSPRYKSLAVLRGAGAHYQYTMIELYLR